MLGYVYKIIRSIWNHGSLEDFGTAQDMAAVQPLLVNGVQTNGFGNGGARDKAIVNNRTTPRYAVASATGLDGPDQILSSDVDTTCEASGRVRLKLDGSIDQDDFKPISVPGLLARTAARHPDHPALVSRPDATGKRTTYTYREYEQQVRQVAKAFLHLGLERHHSVCILGFNTPQWFISDIAAIYAGGFAAGIYTTNSPEACQYCAESSRANIIVVEDDKQLQKILQIRAQLPKLKAIVQFEGVPQHKDVLSWEDLLELGRQQSEDKLEAVLKTIGVNECCTLVYTSGTVGNPKAVMISHDNVLTNAKAILSGIDLKEGRETAISYLPLSHVAAQVVDIFTCMLMAGTVHFADKNALKGSLLDTLVSARPTAFLGVPRVWEKIYEKMQAVARSNGPIKTWIANWAKAQGLHYNQQRMNGVDYKSWGYLIAKWLVFDKVKAALGLDRCHLFGTAAAPLSTEVKKYFMSLDIVIVDVYGMSECAGAHTLCSIDNFRLGSVGHALPGFTTKLDNMDSQGEGEICMAGRHVFMGYLNDPEKTREAKDENNWLHTGDLGKMDEKNLLYVTGRIKELVITAGGENIAPVHIEQLVKKECPALSNAMLIGDRRKYLTMLVTLKTEMDIESGEPLDKLLPEVQKWAKSLGSQAKTVSEVIKTQDPLIHKAITEAITRANEKAISNAQRVQKFRILPHDFSVPTGELGPTLKLKRNVVLKMYANVIEEMYQEKSTA
ncbi:very long-chain-fatty-acid--CoA ligase bubblegum isoform X1 [Trichogramma pretiosum]|uniref:very long-chain-fatty-acid--CoA ligase bubblegum isoform X1 n=2 Tax=Trichogramma pretiosum TaxID=7493 RepID=UPI0006C96C5D|nr:very long-chain-fatty-acid--CoA ligase bubblegum isoform X1 [Trichogramma pretiosum]